MSKMLSDVRHKKLTQQGRSGPGVLVSVLGLTACLAALGVVLLTGSASSPVPSLLVGYDATADPTVMTFGAAHWDSTRLPEDRRNSDDRIRMRGELNPLAQLASHMGGVHLPKDRVQASRNQRHVGEKINNEVRALDFVGSSASGAPAHWLQPASGNTGLRRVSRNMAGELADSNSAAALRQQSFRWALKDCKKESSCENLLGKKLYNVLQTRSGSPNLAIYHDQDDDRKDEERTMENDYRSASRNSEGGDGESQSENRWQKLQGMMHRSFKASAPTAVSVLRQVSQIKSEHLPMAEERILVSALMRKSRVARKAANLNDSYRSETSLIFGGSNGRAHWNTYKASMMPSSEDGREEMGEDVQQHARPSEADKLRKYQTKAAKEMSDSSTSNGNGHSKNNRNTGNNAGRAVNGLGSSRDSKHAISSAAQRQVFEWTEQASDMRHKLADGSVSALRSKRMAGEKSRDAMASQNTQDTIDDELSRYGSVFSSRADEDKLQNEEHVARKALREGRIREQRLQRERARQHNKIVVEEVKEAKSADSELSSYDDAFVPHAHTGPSMASLGLTSGDSDTQGSRGKEGRRGRRTAHRDFRAPARIAKDRQTWRIPKDSAAHEERRDQRTAEDIAPMVKLAENTLKSIGRMHTSGESSRGGDGKCYLAGGKEVPCTELAELGNLMKKVYGTKAGDVAIVARDNQFDPTKIFANTQEAKDAEKNWMKIEDGGDGEHAARPRVRESERRAKVHNSRPEVREHRSSMGELLHEANIKAVKDQTKPVDKGPLGALNDNLGSVFGW